MTFNCISLDFFDLDTYHLGLTVFSLNLTSLHPNSVSFSHLPQFLPIYKNDYPFWWIFIKTLESSLTHLSPVPHNQSLEKPIRLNIFILSKFICLLLQPLDREENKKKTMTCSHSWWFVLPALIYSVYSTE